MGGTIHLSIDPGTTKSGFVVMQDRMPIDHGVAHNHEILALLDTTPASLVTCEMVACYGMSVGASVFETCVWIGRFMQSYRYCDAFKRVTRMDVKMHLCKIASAKDSNVRQAVIDLYEPSGDGKVPQVGTKKNPGPLYGVKSHAWAALAIGNYAYDCLICERERGDHG